MENTFYTDFNWVGKVVESSTSLGQLDCSRNCFTNFINKHKSNLDKDPRLFEKISKEFNDLYYQKFLSL